MKDIKVGAISYRIRLEVGNKSRSHRFSVFLWLRLPDYTLWFKIREPTTTWLLFKIFGRFGFSLHEEGIDKRGYVAIFVTEPQDFRDVVKLIKVLSKEKLLISPISEDELVKKCVFRKLEA